MASEWPIQKLQAVARELTVGHVGTMADQYASSGVLFLRSLNIRPFGIDLSDVKYVSPEFHTKIKKSELREGDVVIVRTGRPGTCAVIPSGLGATNCSDLVIVRCGPDLRPHFLCYWVNAMAGHHVSAHAVGAVQQHFNVGSAKLIELPVPALRVQDRVLGVLRAIDDRIDNLRQANATLEAIAQALFKSWFVDFDPVRAKAEGREPEGMDAATAALFPSEFEDSELGPIPKSWRRVRFGDVATQTKGSVNPLASPERVFQHYSLPAFDTGQLPVAEAGEAIKSNKTPVPSGTVLVSKLNPHIPRIWFVGEVEGNSVCSTEFLVWTPKSDIGSAFLYCIASSTAFNSAMRQLVTGTSNSHQRVKSDQLANVQAAVVSEAAVLAFEAIAAPLLQQVERNRHRGATLAALRDTLLPRLISGKLRLPDVVEEVVAV